MTTAYIGIRSRFGDAPGYVREGLIGLKTLGTLARNSDLYRVGPSREAEQPAHYMAVAEVRTRLAPADLARELEDLEQRVLGTGTRTTQQAILELDVLRVGGTVLSSEDTLSAYRVPLSELTGRVVEGTSDDTERIAHSAALEEPRIVDYDEPGGAGVSYDELRPLSAFNQNVFVAASEAVGLEPGMRVLDVGCGTGRFTRLLAQSGACATGLDRSRTMLAAARATPHAGAAIEYLEGDANVTLPADHYDAILFFLSIHYMVRDEAFWHRVHSALRSQGIVAIATFPHVHIIENELTEFFPSIPRVDLPRFPAIPALSRSLREHRFENVEVRNVATKDTSTAEALIARVERKYVSSLHLIDAEEFKRGMTLMHASLASTSVVRRTVRASIVSARTP